MEEFWGYKKDTEIYRTIGKYILVLVIYGDKWKRYVNIGIKYKNDFEGMKENIGILEIFVK